MFKTRIWWQPESEIGFVTVTSPSPLEFQSLSDSVSLSGNLTAKLEFNDQQHQAKPLELSSGVKLLSFLPAGIQDLHRGLVLSGHMEQG